MKTLFIPLFLLAILLASCSSTNGIAISNVCYPSGYIPAMNVYLKNQKIHKIYYLDIKEDQSPFKFKKIPGGNYIAFAYTVQEVSINLYNKTSIANGGFTHAVPCGLTVDCEDHSLLIFNIEKGKTTKSIKIYDWFEAIMPRG